MHTRDRASRTSLRPRRARLAGAVVVGTAMVAVLAPAAPAGAVSVPSSPNSTPTTAPRNGAAVVAWGPSQRNGGSAILRYVAFASPGGRTCTTTRTRTRLTCTVTGLRNGTIYRFTVRAYNAVGASPPTPQSAFTLVGVPTAPLNASVVSLAASARVAWRAPLSNGGAPIVRTTVTASPGGRTCTTSGTTCVVSGLANGTTYRFSVAAANAYGTGPGRPASTSPVTVGTPSAIRNAQVSCAGAGVTQVTGLAPASPGAGPILRYEGRGDVYSGTLLLGSQDWTSNGLSLSFQQSGLPKGFRVVAQARAVNRVGPGPAVSVSFITSC